MLKLLLDEHISPDVAAGLRRRSRTLTVHSLVEWEGGSFLGQEDAAVIGAASAPNLTLVTYDRRSIPALLKTWAEQGRSHAGIIFVDEKTISQGDIGGLVRALSELFKEAGQWEWKDRVYFLRR